jgi:predicted PurR-regulated permease PerM
VSTDEQPPTNPSRNLPPRFFPGGERIANFALVIAVLGATLYMLWPILVGPFLGLAGGALFRPVVDRRESVRGRRLTAGAITTLVVMLVFGPMVVFLIWLAGSVAHEVVELSKQVHELEAMINAGADRLGPLGPPLRDAATGLNQHLTDALPTLAQGAGDFAGAIGKFLAEFTIGLLLFCLTQYYTLLEGAEWRARFIAALPVPAEIADEILSHFRKVSISVIVGGLGTTFVQTLVAALGYWIFGFDAPLFWALITGVASFVPFVGTALIYIPMAIVHGFDAGWVQALFFLGYGVLVVGTVDNIVRPLLVRAGLQIHPLLVFLSLFGGLATFGVMGIFTGPLLMATAVSALKFYEKIPVRAQ